MLDLSVAEKEIPSEEGLTPIQSGKLVLDAICAPTDNAWPLDVQMLKRARSQTEAMIDELPTQRPSSSLKHRTYREKLQ